MAEEMSGVMNALCRLSHKLAQSFKPVNFMLKGSILVTGATGFIGSELVLTLAMRGHPVVAHASHSASSVIITALKALPNVTVSQSDLGDLSDLQTNIEGLIKSLEVSAVFHCAAISSAETCENDRALAERINVNATGVIAKFCESHNIPLFFLSTDMVFAEPPSPPKTRYVELDLPDPKGAYPEAKRQAELLVLSHSQGYVLRNALTLGLAELNPKRGVLAGMIQILEEAHQQRVAQQGSKQLVYLEAFIDEWRTPISLYQLMESCLALVRLCPSTKIPHILNMAGKDRLSRFEIAGIIAEQFGYSQEYIKPVERRSYLGAFHRPADCSLSGDLTQSVLGVPRLSLKEGLGLFQAKRQILS